MVARNEISSPQGNRVPPEESKNQLVSILGIRISNLLKHEAVDIIEQLIQGDGTTTTHAIYIVNAHTLNIAAESPSYHRTLNSSHMVLGDGTGVRWAARKRGVLMRDNLVGTDLMPELFAKTAGRGHRYFLLGGDQQTVSRAADFCLKHYPGWELAGFHHGYLGPDNTSEAIEAINSSRADVLLVGMGNPRQEQWIHEFESILNVPVAIGVGGLFDHWAGNLTRAPLWVRKRGFEWLQLLLQQPHKCKRYLIGNPKFLIRMVRTINTDRS